MTQITLDDVFSHKHTPYPWYAQLREQGALAHYSWRGMEMWLATSYDDAIAILREPRFSLDRWMSIREDEGKAARREEPAGYVPLVGMRHLLNTEPPDHTRLRSLVSKAFTPRMIEHLRPRIQQITDDLIDKIQEQGQMDLIADFAFPLPITVILEMLGIPFEHRQQFRAWTQAIVQSQSAALEAGKEAEGVAAERAFIDYVKNLVVEKRRHPDDTDLISKLLQVEEKGDTLSEDELNAMIFLLITAGHETTVNLIGNGTLALLEHPEQMELLRADPALLPSAVEELLRYTAPVSLSAPRWATEDVMLHGQVIHKGEMVRCALLAANTDPQHFPDPEALNILRQETQHLSFGKGIHFCLGAPLARVEGQIALGTLLHRLPHLRLASDPEQLLWKESGSLRVLAALCVRF